MVGTSSAPTSLKEYLKKYTSNDDDDKKKKKKKKKAKPKPDAAGVRVVDEDPIWQKPVELNEEEEESADEAKPQVDEDIEVKRMKRLEQIRSRRPFGAISEDGSGWVSVSDNPNNLKSEDQNSDISPPRKRRVRNDTPSPKAEQPSETQEPRFPGGRTARYDTPSPESHREPSEPDRMTDLSPPRRQQRDMQIPSHSKAMDSDMSPPRRSSFSTDLSPPRKVKNADTADHVPSVSDLSPPRRRRKEAPLLVDRPKTGLVSGVDVKDEIDKKRKEDWLRFKEMDPSVSGRGAEAVYRDKITGKRMTKEEFLESQKKKMKKDEKPKEIKLEWGKGLAQKREAEARLQEIEAEKEKPFARSRDDPDLDAVLKERVRWGDPMAHLVKKKNLGPALPDLGDNERMKESGFIVPQEIPKHSWIIRGLDPAPNRYGIKPGRHWDGVDRSTGYEKEMFKRTNEKRATEREAYLWSVSEM